MDNGAYGECAADDSVPEIDHLLEILTCWRRIRLLHQTYQKRKNYSSSESPSYSLLSFDSFDDDELTSSDPIYDEEAMKIWTYFYSFFHTNKDGKTGGY